MPRHPGTAVPGSPVEVPGLRGGLVVNKASRGLEPAGAKPGGCLIRSFVPVVSGPLSYTRAQSWLVSLWAAVGWEVT
jgi:hypothetical protein